MEPPPVPIPSGSQDTTAPAEGHDGGIQPTQQPPPATQPAVPDRDKELDPNTWGMLISYSFPKEIIRFQRWKREYRIGRSPAKEVANDVILNGLQISSLHCTIKWDGQTAAESSVVVSDHSRNGTWVNGTQIGNGCTALLRNGNSISFGTGPGKGQDTEDGKKEVQFEYVYRHTAYIAPTNELYQHYDIDKALGKGTFATVFKALRRNEGKFYAVKVIELKKLRNDWTNAGTKGVKLEDIDKEIRILQRLQHPNVCELKEFFLDDNALSLVLEWVPGGDLLGHLLQNYREDKLMPERRAQHLTYQICKALAYVHSRGIAHRDLKPENVLLTKDNPPIVKVADFGLAKAIDGESILKTICGTPVYLAPEVVTQGGQGYSVLVDSWSVGVIVFSMLTLKMPFHGETTECFTADTTHRVPQWHLLYARRASAEAEDFLRSLLENDPEKRMNMSDACYHPWLAEQVERDLNIPPENPLPPSPSPVGAPHVTASESISSSSATLSSDTALYGPSDPPTMKPVRDTSPDPPSQRLASIQLNTYESVPGLELTRRQRSASPDTAVRTLTPSSPAAPATEADDDRAASPLRKTKRTASLAFSSSSGSIDGGPGDPSRAAQAPSAAEPAGTSTVNAGAAGRAPPTKRIRVEAAGPSSDEEV
ncbi:kinase-like domain-containing protein [Trametes polyzona]|nr:kinase-like domain-containing protein [Trametes polyzona]